jgi:protein-S-isoprenylcysteine O-methyltransferase Ste14
VKLFLAIRALLFVALLPGVVAGYVPYRMLLDSNHLRLSDPSVASLAAFVLFALGTLVLLRCVWDFFASGGGTLAPVDPPRRLVICGLYRYTRNPMYNGVLAILLGEAWLFHSTAVLKYAAFVFVAFHLFVVLYEEPALESRFQGLYRAYRRSVPRWGFTTHPYEERIGSAA